MLIVVGNYMVYAASTFPAAYPLIAAGGAALVTGFIINWNAGKQLELERIE